MLRESLGIEGEGSNRAQDSVRERDLSLNLIPELDSCRPFVFHTSELTEPGQGFEKMTSKLVNEKVED
jgi:hypothetical protein